jgi:two-component system LytT family sensor kinase
MTRTIFGVNYAEVRRRSLQLVAIFACWTVAALISLARRYMEEAGAADSRPVWRVFLLSLTCYYSWAIMTPAVFAVARRWPLKRHVWPKNFTVHIPLSVVFTGASIFLSRLFYLSVEHLPLTNLGGYLADLHFSSFLKHFPFYWTTIAIANLLYSFRALQQKERLAAQLELERSKLETTLRQAQLDALRMQLNPHFLFNTLQTISVLMMDDTASANRMLVRLSDLLRSTLRSSVDALSPLRDEIAFLRAYLEIEQVRFADRLRVEWKIDPRAELALVPTLLLQPLVENAIRHGIARLSKPGLITISALVERGELRLSIADTGPGLTQDCEAAGHGIGLSNTRTRLRQIYSQHEMEIFAPPPGGFEVRIAIPFSRKTEVVEELVAK